MTREKAIAILNENRPKILWEDNETQERMENLCKALDVAIKALEQEPVLDKIRAEIANALSDGMIHKKTVLGIIDKYKAESEG